MNYRFLHASNTNILDFLFGNANLTILPFVNCSEFILFEFFNLYALYDNTFCLIKLHRHILTAQGVSANKYAIAPNFIHHKPVYSENIVDWCPNAGTVMIKTICYKTESWFKFQTTVKADV